MRVMVVGPTDADSFADNVGATLKRAGHDVLMAGPARRVAGPVKARNALHVASDHLPKLDASWQRHLVSGASRFDPHVVITLDSRLRPSVVSALKSGGGRVVLWFPDHVSNLGNHQLFLAGYDRIYLKIPPVVDQLSRLQGLPVAYLPEAANPLWHRPTVEYGTDPYIVVAGHIHPTRAILLQRLLDAEIPLRIYGAPISSWVGFPEVRAAHQGRSIVREEKARVFRAARGVLNNLHPAEIAGSNCRLFEATASGAAVLTEWRPGMDHLFDASSEVIPFRDFEELRTLAQNLLADRDFGQAVGNNAARRALAEHTYDKRLKFIFEDLEL